MTCRVREDIKKKENVDTELEALRRCKKAGKRLLRKQLWPVKGRARKRRDLKMLK